MGRNDWIKTVSLISSELWCFAFVLTSDLVFMIVSLTMLAIYFYLLYEESR